MPPPSIATTTVPAFHTYQAIQANSHGLGFRLPLRNRRMTAPTGVHKPQPRRLPLSTLPALQYPFVSPHQASSAPISSVSFVINNGPGYKIRNATDLLEAMQAHPNETFANIQALGNDNIRLSQQLVTLQQEMEKRMDENRQANEKHGKEMTENLKKLYEYQNGKEHVLHTCISRLETDVCSLRGGGKVVRGLWFSDAEFAAANQLVISGESNWDLITVQKLAAQHSSSENSNGSEEGMDIKGKGKAKERTGKGKCKEKKKPRWNPNAVGLP